MLQQALNVNNSCQKTLEINFQPFYEISLNSFNFNMFIENAEAKLMK